MVLRFLQSDGGPTGDCLDPLSPLTSLRHVREIVLQTRELYRTVEVGETGAGVRRERIAAGPVGAVTRSDRIYGAAVDTAGNGAGGAAAYDEEGAVGDLEGGEDDHALLAVGVAPDDARPPGTGSGAAADSDTPGSGGRTSGTEDSILSSAPAPGSAPAPPDKNLAYETYKLGAGAELSRALTDNKVRTTLYWEGVTHRSLYCRLAKFHGLTIGGKRGAVIGRETRFLVCAQ